MNDDGGGMNRPLHLALLGALIAGTPAKAAERNYTVTDFNQIRVIGPFKVRLTTNVAPFARASGNSAALDGVAIDVNGRVLTVRRNSSASSGYQGRPTGPVEIEIGGHDLASAGVIGSGSLDVSGVRGMAFSLSIEGAGAARVSDVAVDQLKVWIAGTGSASLAGAAKSATLLVRGMSALDGSALSIDNVTLGSEGPSMVRLTVTDTAKVDAKGVSQVELLGSPACTVKAAGSATVSGCR
jgi:hypothetical protein